MSQERRRDHPKDHPTHKDHLLTSRKFACQEKIIKLALQNHHYYIENGITKIRNPYK